jgi:hypothetical protein
MPSRRERMPYDRLYSVNEVERILDASEQHGGHSISRHTKEAKDLWVGRRPKGKVPPPKDSIFMVSRTAMIAIVREVLNSPSGQAELGRLNDPNVKKVEISSVVLREGADFDVLTIYRPTVPEEKAGPVQTYFDWLSTTKGDGFIVQVKVVVFRATYGSNEEIHILTTFPDKYARTHGDRIVGERP